MDQHSNGVTPGFPTPTLSDTVRGLRTSASSALALVAKDNPGVQRLVSGYGQWENQLRGEASRRLAAGAGVRPGPAPGFGRWPESSGSGRESLPVSWEGWAWGQPGQGLLESAAAAGARSAGAAGGPGGGGKGQLPMQAPHQVHLHQRAIGAAAGHAMKRRSASENCLVQMGQWGKSSAATGGAGRAAGGAAAAATAAGTPSTSSAAAATAAAGDASTPQAGTSGGPEGGPQPLPLSPGLPRPRISCSSASPLSAFPTDRPGHQSHEAGRGSAGAAQAALQVFGFAGAFGFSPTPADGSQRAAAALGGRGAAEANLSTCEADLLFPEPVSSHHRWPTSSGSNASAAGDLGDAADAVQPAGPEGGDGAGPDTADLDGSLPGAEGAGRRRRAGMHRVLTAPSSLHQVSLQQVQEGGAVPDPVSEAARSIGVLLLDQSLEALRSAERSIRETATNCHQNLSVLGSLLHQNVASNTVQTLQSINTNQQQNLLKLGSILQHNALATGPGGAATPQHAGIGGAMVSEPSAPWAMVPWGSPAQGAVDRDAVPWPLQPHGLREREREDHDGAPGAAAAQWLPVPVTDSDPGPLSLNPGDAQVLAPGSEAPSSLQGGDWVLPFNKFLQQAEQGRRRPPRSLREDGRQVAIVTTAALPWLTGTSVNPLLRAAYLSEDAGRKVTLVIPWLSAPDQDKLFPANTRFESPEAQEVYVREWARTRTGLDCDFRISFYPGRYAAEKGSILPVGDITQVIPDHEADVAVLEEPEHLTWFHHGRRWTDKFNHVVGVMHTNYLDYARREQWGQFKEMIVKHVNSWVCRVHCHKVIKLSDAVQTLPREETMFVHGVSPSFIKVGQRKASEMSQLESRSREAKSLLPGSSSEAASPVSSAPCASASCAAPGPSLECVSAAPRPPLPEPWSKGVYFIGKVLWAKGYTELLERMNDHVLQTGQNVGVDVYGSGPDLKAVQEVASRRNLNLSFKGARDHAHESIQDYKVFVNPSLSDVVATTTAEALAMGKFVICADHPSNRFFTRFPNCLIYRDSCEFSRCLATALSQQPQPLTPQELRALSWEAATERFLDTAEIKQWQNPLEAAMDGALHVAHNTLTGIEAMRVLIGAGTKTRDTPQRVTDFVPRSDDLGGPFDNHARAREAQAKSGS